MAINFLIAQNRFHRVRKVIWRLYFRAFLLIAPALFLPNCVAVYRHVRDKRDRSYKEGVELYNQNKTEEARGKFETVADIEPDYRDTARYLRKIKKIRDSKEKFIRKQSKANYNRGVALMKVGKYDGALKSFLLADEDDASLLDLDEKIAECREKLHPHYLSLLKTAQEQFAAKRYIVAYSTCLKAGIYNPSDYELATLKNKIEERLEGNAEKYTKLGTRLYEKKQYAAAQKQFRFALKVYPWDQKIKALDGKVTALLNLENNYQKGLWLYHKGRFFEARTLLQNVNQVEPGYKATNDYLNKIHAGLVNQIDTIFNNGVANYNKENYSAAVAEFDTVLSINPNHSTAAEYRQRAKSNLDMKQSLTEAAPR